MPWKEGYTISDEKSLADAEIRWPDHARCCVTVTVDSSVAAGPEGITAADLATPEAPFGANQGLAALREVLSRHAMRVTFAVPAVGRRRQGGRHRLCQDCLLGRRAGRAWARPHRDRRRL
jgi:peptidoglycan-N-acetylglucosamine deacetylase